MKWLQCMGGLLMGALLWSPDILKAQQASADVEESGFFEELAREDAMMEQSLRLTKEEDQQDYWSDQRSFEAELKKLSYKMYVSYLNGKSEAYASHKQDCSLRCGHGSYYYLQAEFYGQFNAVILTQQLSSVDENSTNGKIGLVKNEDPK